MAIHVELFGIPRQRAGTASVTVETAGEEIRLGDVLFDLAARFPTLAETCFAGDRLQSGYVANIEGDRFVIDPETRLRSGVSLLIMSADAGG